VTSLKRIKDALHKASGDATHLMSAHLRSEARASGWPEHIVRTLRVSHNNGEFHIHAHPDHHAEIQNLEYGTPSTQPTAAIRRFNNRQSQSEHFLLGRAMAHLGGKL
jgi:hypothetical protein